MKRIHLQRLRGVPVESAISMWLHRMGQFDQLIKMDEGEYYGRLSRASNKQLTNKKMILSAEKINSTAKDGE